LWHNLVSKNNDRNKAKLVPETKGYEWNVRRLYASGGGGYKGDNNKGSDTNSDLIHTCIKKIL